MLRTEFHVIILGFNKKYFFVGLGEIRIPKISECDSKMSKVATVNLKMSIFFIIF